jgi:arylamine N-acetyltransferase
MSDEETDLRADIAKLHIDWDSAPHWANWYTQDQHGECWFDYEPDYSDGRWRLSEQYPQSKFMQFSYRGGWQQAIARPQSVRNAELCRKRTKPKSQLTVWEKAGEWAELRDELARAIYAARRYSQK